MPDHFGARVEGAEHVTTCAVEEAWNHAKRLALRTFAAAGCAEEKISAVETRTTVLEDPGRRVAAGKVRSDDCGIHMELRLLRFGIEDLQSNDEQIHHAIHGGGLQTRAIGAEGQDRVRLRDAFAQVSLEFAQ